MPSIVMPDQLLQWGDFDHLAMFVKLGAKPGRSGDAIAASCSVTDGFAAQENGLRHPLMAHLLNSR